ncbi:MAG TPA: NAD(P)H-hydrate dehydratase [Nitrospiraceae bacterium]|nr:NAD(P)H-hydrate dehydratase [Nitrospiraceae bacterium]
MKIVSAAQMKELDRRTIAEAKMPGATLMERAGRGVVTAMERAAGSLSGKTVAILCGKGNNGGDGFVVARLLRKRRARIRVLLLAHPGDLSGDAKTMHRKFLSVAGAKSVLAAPAPDAIRDALVQSDMIVDALLGTGLSATVSAPYRAAIEAINEASVPVVAVDLPSGIHADTGAVMGAAVRADMTVTFGLPKLGLYTGAGLDHAGRIEVVDIGIPQTFVETIASRVSLITMKTVRRLIPDRRVSSHKGTYGHAGIVAGSVGKTGAAAMAARAALRVGAGLVTVATPASVNDTLEAKLLEAMTVPMPETKARTLARAGLEEILSFVNARTAVAIGPGLTTHPETVELIHALLPRLEKPSVLDADALNALAGRTSLVEQCKVPPILTPHPGEMARLVEGASARAINDDRIGTAVAFAQARRVMLVLKGARTVVAHPDGRTAVCSTGNPGMATAGTGDVLTGMIVGLLAQGLSPWDAACAGTYLHGLAGDLAAAERGLAGMTAGDVIEQIPHALTGTVHGARG